MKLLDVKSLCIPDIKVIRFQRFGDDRGYFTESFRRSDFDEDNRLAFLENVEFVQCNESFSRPGVIRGLHFQWNPYMGKLVRCYREQLVLLRPVGMARRQDHCWSQGAAGEGGRYFRMLDHAAGRPIASPGARGPERGCCPRAFSHGRAT